ncbi:MAG: hypothetical protein OXU73_02040 [Candidatus Campbellbacteria bacterium]|nr:hypothetical protein [Candidatus Campbellbacteria bacterium]
MKTKKDIRMSGSGNLTSKLTSVANSSKRPGANVSKNIRPIEEATRKKKDATNDKKKRTTVKALNQFALTDRRKKIRYHMVMTPAPYTIK